MASAFAYTSRATNGPRSRTRLLTCSQLSHLHLILWAHADPCHSELSPSILPLPACHSTPLLPSFRLLCAHSSAPLSTVWGQLWPRLPSLFCAFTPAVHLHPEVISVPFSTLAPLLLLLFPLLSQAPTGVSLTPTLSHLGSVA